MGLYKEGLEISDDYCEIFHTCDACFIRDTWCELRQLCIHAIDRLNLVEYTKDESEKNKLVKEAQRYIQKIEELETKIRN